MKHLAQRLAQALQTATAQHIDRHAARLRRIHTIGLLAIDALEDEQRIGVALIAADHRWQTQLADDLFEAYTAHAKGIDTPLAEGLRLTATRRVMLRGKARAVR